MALTTRRNRMLHGTPRSELVPPSERGKEPIPINGTEPKTTPSSPTGEVYGERRLCLTTRSRSTYLSVSARFLEDSSSEALRCAHAPADAFRQNWLEYPLFAMTGSLHCAPSKGKTGQEEKPLTPVNLVPTGLLAGGFLARPFFIAREAEESGKRGRRTTRQPAFRRELPYEPVRKKKRVQA